jgi:hypothetical protein
MIDPVVRIEGMQQGFWKELGKRFLLGGEFR